MGGIGLLQDLLDTIVERGSALAGINQNKQASVDTLKVLSDSLLTTRGEASGVALSSQFLDDFAGLASDQVPEFFRLLAENYDPDQRLISEVAASYSNDPSIENFIALENATSPPRRQLLRRINLAPCGTESLVHMREKLIPLLSDNPDLKRVDHDFLQLFKLWFNRGFLVLRQIDWSTSADILEKIIAYEAVHEIGDWDELRRRLLPEDRRCFAFFHPSMPDDPLIFVEVALTIDIPGSIQQLLAEDREPLKSDHAKTAVFYSISNCQKGLTGVSFGSFLIKRVAEHLSKEIPSLQNFVTLSPIPGFTRWMNHQASKHPNSHAAKACTFLKKFNWENREKTEKEAEKLLKPLAADYLGAAKDKSGQPLDPVEKFHISNGAILYKLHCHADISEKGKNESASLMVNYLYNLTEIERNHERFAETGDITVSREVKSLSPSSFDSVVQPKSLS